MATLEELEETRSRLAAQLWAVDSEIQRIRFTNYTRRALERLPEVLTLPKPKLADALQNRINKMSPQEREAFQKALAKKGTETK